MLIPVSQEELSSSDYLNYDVFGACGTPLLRAGDTPARLLKSPSVTAKTLFYKRGFDLSINHEGAVYQVPEPELSLGEREAHHKQLQSPGLIEQDRQERVMRSLKRFWLELEEGKAADIALLQVVNQALVSDITSNVNELQYLSQLRVRDGFTYDHTMDVAAMSIALASKLGLSKTEIREVGTAAILHDLGKLLIPKSIMFKSGRLSEQEFKVMKRHPELGYNILRYELKLPDPLCRPALEHQEMWAGGGYPLNLAKHEIHFYSQIVKIADVYDALTSRRPYKEPIPSQKALTIMKGEGDKSFNPELLEVFCNLANFQEDTAENTASLKTA